MPAKKPQTEELAGMPAPLDTIEVSLVGKDTWVNHPTRHKSIKVGKAYQLTVVGHVSQVGIRESGPDDGDDVDFIKIKIESIEPV